MTRGRWIAFGVTAGVVLLAFWLWRAITWTSIDVETGLKGEARTNPFYAAQRFAEQLGATTTWEHALGDAAPDAVVFASGFHWSLIPSRRKELERWVESGGRLVADNQLLGTEEFGRWSGITREFPKAIEDADADDTPAEDENVFSRAERCHDIAGDGRSPYRVCQFLTKSWLASKRTPIWTLQNASGLQAVRVGIGRGTVTMLNASPFAARSFIEGDHARLFVALTQLRHEDEIHFLSEDETPSLIALIWRNGAPVVVLFAAWLALTLWRGGVRLGPLEPRAELVRRSLAEQIRGTAHFALRIGDGDVLHTATLRALARAAQRRIPGYLSLDTDARAAAIARVTSTDAAALTAAISAIDLRRVHDLRSAVALLETARRQLLRAGAKDPAYAQGNTGAKDPAYAPGSTGPSHGTD